MLGAAHAARRGGLVRLAGAVLGITDCCVDDPAGFSEIPVEYRVTIVWLVYRGAARGLGQMPGRVCCCGVSDSSGLPVAQR
ncbi:MAG: hypothetical protein M3R63_02865 [Actinomycetota bacterium]|nr:hypothetical protein [Actinomycetota bacterium]